MNEYLPAVRCEPELKQKLELIIAHSVSPRLSDHLRHAVEEYVEANWTPALEAKLADRRPRRPIVA